FPIWTRRLSPEGRLVLPDNEHSLAESFGAGLTKAGGWLKEYADSRADTPPSGDKDIVGGDGGVTFTIDDATDQGPSLMPDDGWDTSDLWPHGWTSDDKGSEPHI